MYMFASLTSVIVSALVLNSASAAVVTPLGIRELEKFATRSAIVHPPTYLTPTPFNSRSKWRRAEDDYQLKLSETWTWNLNGSTTAIAKADCRFKVPDGQQPWNGRTVPLERLMDNVANLQCSNNIINLKWKDQKSFQAAKESWNWVNQDKSRYIAMVTNSPACRGQRQVYKVTSYTTDDSSLTMTLNGRAVDFKDAFPYVHFRLSTTGVTPAANTPRALAKRADASIPLAQDFSGTEIFKQNVSDIIDIALVCGNCKTTGTLDIDFEATSDVTKVLSLDSPVSATLTLMPKGFSATLGLNLVASAKIAEGFTKSVTFVNIPLLENPLAVAGIADIGPSLMINMDATIGEVTAQVDFSIGSVTMSISDDAKATIDFFGDEDSSSEGFEPVFTSEGPSLNAGISATASLGPNFVLGVDAAVFGTGVAGGLALAAPKLAITAAVGTEQSCKGVDITSDLSAQLNAFAGVGKIAEVAAENTVSLVATSTQLFSTCFTLPTGAPAPMDLPPSGGVIGTALNDEGCRRATNSLSALAPKLCGKDGGVASDSSDCPVIANQCCDVAMVCGVAALGTVQGLCCT